MITRSTSSALNPRTALLGACVMLFVVSLTPTRYSGWTEHLSSPAQYLIAPLQNPLTWAVSKLRGPAPTGRPIDPNSARLAEELNIYRVLYYRTLDDKQRLEQIIVQLQHGMALNPDLPVRQFNAPVIGRYSDLSTELLKIRGGTANGITLSSVAAFEGVNLVGRVVSVSDRISSVLPITDRHAGELKVKVYPNETSSTVSPDPGMFSILCRVVPTGRGRLRGPAEYSTARPGETPPRVGPGMIARLADATWPRSAQSLVVGIIESVDKAANGREIVTIKPMFDLQRLPEVSIRISGEGDAPLDGADPVGDRPKGTGGRP